MPHIAESNQAENKQQHENCLAYTLLSSGSEENLNPQSIKEERKSRDRVMWEEIIFQGSF
jgi:hypothetical protein